MFNSSQQDLSLNFLWLIIFCDFTDNADGLCCKLQQMCMKPRSLIWAFDRGKADEYATTRDTVLRVKKLGSGQFAEVWLGREVVYNESEENKL